MSKPGRNELCPCGSGKKFKKCCGKNNVVAFDPSIYSEELDNLQRELIDYMLEQHEEDVFEITLYYTEKYLQAPSEEDIAAFSEAVVNWAAFMVPNKKNDILFKLFHRNTINKIKYPAVKDAFIKWDDPLAGAFEVILNGSDIKLRDLSTDAVYPISFNEKIEYKDGNIIIGTLLPYTNTYEFFHSFIQLPEEYLEPIMDLIENNLSDDVKLVEVFPQFLAGLLQLGRDPIEEIQQLEWEEFSHLKVAQIFIEHATEKKYDDNLINATVRFWNDYSRMVYPDVRKYEAHAAALDYFSHREFLQFTDVTQSKLAAEYGTSASTISGHYNKLAEEFHFMMDMEESNEPMPPSHNTEGQMRDFMNLLGEQEFESETELNEFLQNVMDLDNVPTSERPRDIAQDLLFEARETTGRRRNKLIHEALEMYPLSPDAYILLAEDEQDMDKKMTLLEKAIEVGEKDLGTDFFKENKGHFWGLIETRPYMRAKQTYAMALESLGFAQEAVAAYKSLLALNPSDNQGIRYLLLPLLIELRDFTAAQSLFNQYDEPTAAFVFSKALIQFEKNGMTKDGLKLLEKADETNPFVMDYLIGNRQLPTQSPQYVGMGDENEAIAYAQSNSHLWAEAEEFLQLFLKNTNS